MLCTLGDPVFQSFSLSLSLSLSVFLFSYQSLASPSLSLSLSVSVSLSLSLSLSLTLSVSPLPLSLCACANTSLSVSLSLSLFCSRVAAAGNSMKFQWFSCRISREDLRCLQSRDSNHGSRDFKLLANQIARLETYLKSETIAKPSTAIRMVIGLAIRIVRFEIAADRRRFKSLRTANHDSRRLR